MIRGALLNIIFIQEEYSYFSSSCNFDEQSKAASKPAFTRNNQLTNLVWIEGQNSIVRINLTSFCINVYMENIYFIASFILLVNI